MLRGCGLAVLGVRRSSVTSIGVGSLMGLGIGSGIWVVGLTCLLRAVGSHGFRAARIGSGGRIIGIPNLRGPVRANCGRAGAIVTAMPCVVPVVSRMPIYNRAAMPIAVPRSVAPTATAAAAYRCAHGDANAKRNQARRGH